MGKFFGNLKERHNVLLSISILIFSLFFLRLIDLTFIHGGEYKKVSEGRKYKEIVVEAPRGEIRDKNGVLLAGNKPAFTVQIFKDQIEEQNDSGKKEKLLKLSHILNEEGVVYKDNFPIKMNVFRFKEGYAAAQSTSLNELEFVADAIAENGLIDDILELNMEFSFDDKVERYSIGRKILGILEENEEVPIKILAGETTEYEYLESKTLDSWKKDHMVSEVTPAKSALENLVAKYGEKKILLKVLEDPLSRELIYDYLNGDRLADEVEMVKYEFEFDSQYKYNKEKLIKSFKGITFDSEAKSDFVNIFLQIGGTKDLLNTGFVKDNVASKKEHYLAMERLKEILGGKGVKLPFEAEFDKDYNTVNYKVTSDKKRDDLYKRYGLEKDTSVIDALILIANKEGVLEEFVTDDEVKIYAQQIMLKTVNPNISVNEWDYTSMAEKKSWLSKNGMENVDISAEAAMDHMKKINRIDEGLTDFEARDIISFIDELNSLGYRGYSPINVAYGVDAIVVSRIKENKKELAGIDVSAKPLRYYPMDDSLSHAIGYMGKIAQEDEIEEYIKGKSYLETQLVGKTGIEKSFEGYLKGRDGKKTVQVDAYGNTVKEISEEEPVQGSTVYLTIDSELQKITESSLREGINKIQTGGSFDSKYGDYYYSKAYPYATSGAAVAIDTQTGELLAMASYPSYDPNLFVSGITSEDWKSLVPEDESDPLAARPLYNVATQTSIQPGSTFKMITGMAALDNGISPEKTIYDYGHVDLGDTTFGCWLWNSSRGSHGSVNMADAIAQSCNYYFYSVAVGEVPATGEKLAGAADIDEMMRVAKEFGLGQPTGIEIEGEVSKELPSKGSKKETQKALLISFLNKNIDKYTMKGFKLNEGKKKEAIDEIVSWMDEEKIPSKSVVVRNLRELNLDGEKKINGNIEDFGDIIKYTYLNPSKWSEADTFNISIGQGENSYTPIQVANYIATLANGGTRNKVSVIDRIERFQDGEEVYTGDRDSNKVNLKNMDGIAEVAKGMHQSTTSGLVRIFDDFPAEVAAKTGTAQREGINPMTGGQYDNYSWFTAYAPYEEGNPGASRIAVAVVIFQGGEGIYSAPIGREILGKYLELNK